MPRPLCPECQLPPARCLCDCVIKSQSSIEFIVWQHPNETDHPKNTLPLLKACLPELKIIRGEQIDKGDFLAKTNACESELHLLFPSKPETAPSLNLGLEAPSKVCLLALDGTWRKARKILHLNPWLHELPTVSLTNPPASRYHIRKAEQEGQLSTLEAICAAIEQFEGNAQTSAPILSAFEQYVQKLDAYRP